MRSGWVIRTLYGVEFVAFFSARGARATLAAAADFLPAGGHALGLPNDLFRGLVLADALEGCLSDPITVRPSAEIDFDH
jgi:hypothetical protein